MLRTLLLALLVASVCRSAALYSSFYAPLYDPRILGYRVDARFDPDAGKRARASYEARFGRRGQNLIQDLGSGRGPAGGGGGDAGDNEYGDVRFYYTYPGAYRNKK